jgi:hypothetical protein
MAVENSEKGMPYVHLPEKLFKEWQYLSLELR